MRTSSITGNDRRPPSDGGAYSGVFRSNYCFRVRRGEAAYDARVARTAGTDSFSVVGGFLTASALLRDPTLNSLAGHVADSGEGRWTVAAAIDEGVPAHVLSAALYERFSSRGHADFADRLLAAMRYQFGGHLESAPQRDAGTSSRGHA